MTEIDDTHQEVEDVSTPIVAASTQVVRRERGSEVIRPLDTAQLVESFAAYQDLLTSLLAESDYQKAGEKKFVKKSGWRKIAAAFDLDVQVITSTVERDGDGNPLRAEVIARAIAPSGRAMDGDGYCSVDESRFKSASGKQKLENDLRATATTRAKNRAISDLVGMGDVSAEEISAGPATQAVEEPQVTWLYQVFEASGKTGADVSSICQSLGVAAVSVRDAFANASHRQAAEMAVLLLAGDELGSSEEIPEVADGEYVGEAA